MEKNKDYEKRLGRRLREAYLKDYKGPVMSRDEFHRLIEAVGKKKKHNRTLIGLAAACVAICLVCGGFMTAISMRESASAGKDDETKTVQQGGSVVIGSGAGVKDQNVGISTRTYTGIEYIPEDLRNQIQFMNSEEFELEKVKVYDNDGRLCVLYYRTEDGDIIKLSQEKETSADKNIMILAEKYKEYQGIELYRKEADEGEMYYFILKKRFCSVLLPGKEIKIEAIIDGLLN